MPKEVTKWKIYYRGNFTGTRMEAIVEASDTKGATEEFYAHYDKENKIYKISEVKDRIWLDFNIGLFTGIVITVIIEIFVIMLLGGLGLL